MGRTSIGAGFLKYRPLKATAAREAFEKERVEKSFCGKHGIPYHTDCHICVLVDIRQMFRKLIADKLGTTKEVQKKVVEGLIETLNFAEEE